MARVRDMNQYLDEKSPWKVIKEDRQAAADSLYVALYAISCLKTALYPFLPFSSQKVHEYLGFEDTVEGAGWEPQPPPPGQRLREPRPLFSKLEESVIGENGKPDPTLLKPFCYDPGTRSYYVTGGILGKAYSLGEKFK